MAVATQSQAQAAAQAAALIKQQNRAYMMHSLEHVTFCPVTGGNATNATYTPGTPMFFDLPQTGGGIAKGLLITYNLTVTPASGGTNAYTLNAAAPWNIFSEIKLQYGNTQIRTHPIMLKILDQLKGYQTIAQNSIVNGANNDATVNAQIAGATPLVVGSGNTWIGKQYLRLNPLGDDSIPGCLPIGNVGNRPQLILTPCTAFMGTDPLLNPVNGTGNGTPAVTVSGTVNVDVIYHDGSNMQSPIALAANILAEPTMQYEWDAALSGIAGSNSVNRAQIKTLMEHWYVISIIIDGLQSNQFAKWGNITGFQLSPDQTGQNTLKSWNFNNNISIYDYHDREIRRIHGQDLDAGVIVWADGPARGLSDPDSRRGHQPLNMRPGSGYPAVSHAYQLASVSSATVTNPRIETFLISMNYDGLKVL